jgi:hypothetical protein
MAVVGGGDEHPLDVRIAEEVVEAVCGPASFPLSELAADFGPGERQRLSREGRLCII